MATAKNKKTPVGNIVARADAVDVNCAIGRGTDRLWLHETAADLLGQMDRVGIRRAVVWHRAAGQWNLPDGHALLARELRGRPRLLPCLVATPHLGTEEMPDASGLVRLLRKVRPAALRLFPSQSLFSLHPFYAGELLEIVEAHRLPLILDLESVDAVELATASGQFPNIPFIVVSQFRRSRYLYPLLRQRPNVYLSTRFPDSNQIEEVVDKFGAGRLLYGSGMLQHPPGPALALVTLADLPDRAKLDILGGNWRRIEQGVRWT